VGTQAHVLEEFDDLAACCESLLLQSCESYSIFKKKKRKKDGNIKGGGGIAHLGVLPTLDNTWLGMWMD
jgi:hypothetical protein